MRTRAIGLAWLALTLLQPAPGRTAPEPEAAAVSCRLPYSVGEAYRLLQGNDGPWGHEGAVRYAFDFSMPIGSLVTAARAGVVVQIEQSFEDSTRRPGEENFVFVRHDDGTFGRYYHLTRDGVLVEIGDEVEEGDPIALSGDSGASAGSHLHFDVTIECPEWGCQTVPVRFLNARDPVPVQGEIYEAQPIDEAAA